MDRITHASAIDIGGGRRGFRSKDTVAGQRGTTVTATHMNATQEEMMAVIEKSGLAPSGGVLTQLAQAARLQRLNYVPAPVGTANALSVALDPVPESYVALIGAPLRVRIASTNTAAATLNVNGLGAQPILTMRGEAIKPGDLVAGAIVTLIGASTAWVAAGITYGEVPALRSGLTLYVRPDGNDANDGLVNSAARAKATISGAAAAAASYYVTGGTTIQLGIAGDYAAPGNLQSLAGLLEIRGDPVNIAAYKIVGSAVPAGSVGLIACSFGRMVLTGVKVVNNGSAYGGIGAVGTSSLTIDRCETSMTVANAQAHINAAAGSSINVKQVKHEGFAGYAWLADGGSITQDGPVVLTFAEYSLATVQASSTGRVSRTSGSWTGTAVGRRYAAQLNGVVNSLFGGANFYPGSTAGLIETGGQYV